MVTPVAPPRKRHSTPGKDASAGTIRVAVAIAQVSPSKVAESAPEETKEGDAPGLPCSGKCGRCNHHPCRLHSPV